MKQRISNLLALFVMLSFGMFLATTAAAQTERIVPKAENFVFFVDHSGSMAMSAPSDSQSSIVARQDPNKQEKIEVVKEILGAVNADIPDMTFNAGLYTFGPFQEYMGVAPYSRNAVDKSISEVKAHYDIFGRLTPMGHGLQSLDVVLSGLSERKAVVLTTDGESNLGAKPLPVVRDMYAKHGDSICFHVISFAQTEEQKAMVDEIAAINSCSVVVDGMDLQDDAKRKQFVHDVFYDVEIIPAAPVAKPEPAPEPEVEEVIVFRNVNFDFDKSNIKQEFVPILREAAEIIKSRPGKTVLVDGHTCNIGTAKYNMGLSERRASSVTNFLVKEGVDEDRIKARGYGLTNPRYDNSTREGRALNRRVEIRLE